MNARQILEDYLLLDKSVKLEFPNQRALKSFKSLLYVYKSRYNNKLASIGESDIFDNKSICTEILSEPDIFPLQVRFTLRRLVRENNTFTFISSEDLEDDEKEKS